MKWTAKETDILEKWYPKEGYRGVQQRLVKAGFMLRTKDALAGRAYRLGIKSNNDGKIKPGQSLRGRGFKLTEEQLEKLRPHQFGQNGKRKAEFFDYAISFHTWSLGRFPQAKWLIKLPSQGRKYHVNLIAWIWIEEYGPIPKRQ